MLRFATLAAAAGWLVGGGSAPTASAGPTSVSLARSMPELKLDGVGFGDAIDFLRDVSGAPTSTSTGRRSSPPASPATRA